jgi:hypothetical protein
MIDKLPAELTVDVMNYLRPHDLTKLARVSKRYREFAQSTLWRNVGDIPVRAAYKTHTDFARSHLDRAASS